MNLRTNSFKRSILSGRQQIGLWSSLGSSTVAELLSNAGFDWVLIDTEHAPNELPDVMSQLRAMAGGATTPIVRPAWNDLVIIKRLLDIGATTLLIPYIQDATEAARAVAAVRYPPRGVRGVGVSHRANRYGLIGDYFARAEDEMCLLVQVETQAALAQLEAIADVDGIDGIFIGPSDLAASLGHLGDRDHPEVRHAIADALSRCKAMSVPAGILTGSEDEALEYLAMGFTFVSVGSDIGLLRNASEKLAARFAGGERTHASDARQERAIHAPVEEGAWTP